MSGSRRSRKKKNQSDSQPENRRWDRGHTSDSVDAENFQEEKQTASEINELLNSIQSDLESESDLIEETTEDFTSRTNSGYLPKSNSSHQQHRVPGVQPIAGDKIPGTAQPTARLQQPPARVVHRHPRRHFSWINAWRRSVRYCTPTLLRAPWIILKRETLYCYRYLSNLFSLNSEEMHNTYLVPNQGVNPPDQSISHSLAQQKKSIQPSIARRISRRIIYWMPQPCYAVCLWFARKLLYLHWTVRSWIAPIPEHFHQTWIIPHTQPVKPVSNNQSAHDEVTNQSSATESKVIYKTTSPAVSQTSSGFHNHSVQQDEKIDPPLPKNRQARSVISPLPLGRTLTTQTQKSSSSAAWRLMACAGVIGIILMLLQGFWGQASEQSTTLLISPASSTPELGLQMSLWITPDEDEAFLANSENRRNNPLSAVELSSFSHHPWSISAEKQPLLNDQPAAYTSPLGEYHPGTLASSEPPLTVSTQSDKALSVIVEKEIPAQAYLHQQFQYVLHVRNLDDKPVEHVLIEERVPQPHRVIHVSPDAFFDNETLRWEIRDLAGGESRRLVVNMLPMQGGYFTTTSTMLPTTAIAFQTKVQKPRPGQSPLHIEPVPPQQKATPQPILSNNQPEIQQVRQYKSIGQLEISSPQMVKKGELYRLTIRASNMSEQAEDHFTVRYHVPNQLVCRTGDRLVWDIGSLKPGESATAQITLRAITAGQVEQRLELLAGARVVHRRDFSVTIREPNQKPTYKSGSGNSMTPLPPCDCEIFLPY